MTKDPFQILADELTLIRKGSDAGECRIVR